MLIKMRTMSAGPDGVRHPGELYNLSAMEARDLIAGGYAEDATPPVKAPSAGEEAPEERQLGAPVETATVAPPEKATRRRGGKKKPR
jgi:hypothetical protein